VKQSVPLVLACLILVSPAAPGPDRSQPKPVSVSLIQLIATPERFDGRVVTVQGFLTLGAHPEFFGQEPVLYVNEEDADNLLALNSVWLVPSDQMRRDREKINHMYVRLTGLFRAAPLPGRGNEGGTITQIQACAPWSDPKRPVGLRQGGAKYK
jgi:hypothetical protein